MGSHWAVKAPPAPAVVVVMTVQPSFASSFWISIVSPALALGIVPLNVSGWPSIWPGASNDESAWP